MVNTKRKRRPTSKLFVVLLFMLFAAAIAIAFLPSQKVHAQKYETDRLYLTTPGRFDLGGHPSVHADDRVYYKDFFDVYLTRADGGKFAVDYNFESVQINQRKVDKTSTVDAETRYVYQGESIDVPVYINIETREMDNSQIRNGGDSYYMCICDGVSLWGGSNGINCNHSTNQALLYKNQSLLMKNSSLFKDTKTLSFNPPNKAQNPVGINTGNDSYKIFAGYLDEAGEYRLNILYYAAQQKVNSDWYSDHKEFKECSIDFTINLKNADRTPPMPGQDFDFVYGANNANLISNDSQLHIQNTANGAVVEWLKEGGTYIHQEGQREQWSEFVINGKVTSSGLLQADKFTPNQKNRFYARDWKGNASPTYYFYYDTYAPYLTESGAATLANLFRNSGLKDLLKAKEIKKERSFTLGSTNENVTLSCFYDNEKESPLSMSYEYYPFYQDEYGQTKMGSKEQYQEKTGTTFEFSKSGIYSVTIRDLAQNKTTYHFAIRKEIPNYNYTKITNYSFISAQNYEVKLPTGYTNVTLKATSKYENTAHKYQGTYTINKRYLFENYENALRFAKDVEIEKVAVKTSLGYVYKLVSNQNQTYEYTDKAEFIAAVEHYAKRFISQNESVKATESPYLDTSSVVVLDTNLRKNNAENTPLKVGNFPVFLVGKSFVFSRNNVGVTLSDGQKFTAYDTEKLQIYNTGMNGTGQVDTKGNEFVKPFSWLLGSNEGVYRVVETDSFGNSRTYYVQYDLTPPTIKVAYSEVGKEQIIERNITSNDVLSLYLDTFEIKEIIDLDGIPIGNYFVRIESQTNAAVSGIYYKDFPTLTGNESGSGAGKYAITVYDRNGNQFGFEVYLYGKPPKVTYSASGIGADRKLVATLANGESYNAILGIEIFRNGESLGDSYFNGTETVVISPQTLVYEFIQGGIYHFKILDNFGRTTSTSEYKFVKNMPSVELLGVKENGKTRYDVTASFDIACKFVLRFEGNIISPTVTKDETMGLQYIFIQSSAQTSGSYSLKVFYESDTSNYNEVRFVIYNVPPKVQFKTKSGKLLSSGEATSETVFLNWNITQIISSALYTFNGGYATRYNLNTKEELKKSGVYVFTIKDDLGNSLAFEFIIDKVVSYTVSADGGNGKLIYNGEKDGKYLYTVKNSFSIKGLESGLNIMIYKDGFLTEYTFESIISETGLFYIVMTDSFSNLEEFYIEIDITPPSAKIEGAENNGRTKINVKITLEDMSDVFEVKLYINGKLQSNVYIAGEYLFIETGKFKIELYDKAGNCLSYTFEIDKVVDFASNVISGSITNEQVKIELKEKGSIAFYNRDTNEKVELDGGYIKAEGKYRAVLVDELGNSVEIIFTIDKAIKNTAYEYPLPENATLTKVNKDGKEYNGYLFGINSFIIEEDGKYEVNIAKENLTSKYTFVIDTVPPTLLLNGVEDGGITTKDISFSNFNKSNIKMQLSLDGKETDVNKSSVLSENGSYRLVLTDEAGNSTEYTFTKKYAVNGFGVLFIVLAVIIAILVTLIILKIKFRSKVR